MNWLLDINWEDVLAFQVSPLEIFIRGTLVYIALFVLLRLVLKRQAGGLSITDFLVVVLIADASQNAMASDYKSVPDGVVLVSTIIFWNYAFEWMGYNFKWFEKIVHPAPLPLVKNGRIIVENMRRELVTREELDSQLRQQGVESLKDVKTACMEGDGKISVVCKNTKKR